MNDFSLLMQKQFTTPPQLISKLRKIFEPFIRKKILITDGKVNKPYLKNNVK